MTEPPITNGQQHSCDYTAGADLARNIASYVSDSKERGLVYLAARNILNDIIGWGSVPSSLQERPSLQPIEGEDKDWLRVEFPVVAVRMGILNEGPLA